MMPVETTSHGSSGAAKYLVNQHHLRGVDQSSRVNNAGVDAPQIMNNSNLNHSGGVAASSYAPGTQLAHHRYGGIGDKLKPLLDGNRY